MSLFGSLYTGASGMIAQAKATAMVSQNVANSSTTGYKRSEAFFNELVTTRGSGGVQAQRVMRADQQGGIQQTGIATDISVSGNGFFAVRANEDPNLDLVYTRNGTFSEDRNGILRNTAGYVLHAWAFDQNDMLVGGADASSLVPVDVDVLDLAPVATTQATLKLNLNAAQRDIDPHSISPPQQLPVTDQGVHFSRTITVFDSRPLTAPGVVPAVTAQDVQHDVTFQFRKVVGPMAHFTSNTPIPFETDTPFVGGPATSGIADGDTFTVDVDGDVETYMFVDPALGDDPSINQIATVKGLLDALDQHGTTPEAGLVANINPEGRLLVRAVNPSATITLAEPGPNNPLGNTGLNVVQDPDSPADYIYEPDFDINAAAAPGATAPPALPPVTPPAYPDQEDFPAFANSTDPNPFGWWELSVKKPDPADPTGQTLIEDRTGLINFGTDGLLNATPDADGRVTLDLATTPVDFDPATTGDEVGFTVDITNFTQFAGEFTVITADQNGAGAGQRTGVDITADGIVQARFSNGLRQNLYQIPLAVFNSPNNLNDRSGTVFEETAESGSAVITTPGTMGAGFVNPATLENANVDIADEFGRMIVSQRGYTLNSKVITTIDQMTQRLSEMSR